LNTFHTFSQIHFFHLLLLKSHWLCQSHLNTNISTKTNKQTKKWVNQWNILLIVFCVWKSEFRFIWKWKNKYQTCEQFQIQFVIINLIHFLMWIDFNEFSEEFWSWIENHFVKLKWMSTVLHNQFHVW
jgi:hypothetical protein